jgi:hypothetical protein
MFDLFRHHRCNCGWTQEWSRLPPCPYMHCVFCGTRMQPPVLGVPATQLDARFFDLLREELGRAMGRA